MNADVRGSFLLGRQLGSHRPFMFAFGHKSRTSVSSFQFQVFQLMCSRIITSSTGNSKLSSSGPREGTHAEVQESQRECGCQEHLARSGSAVSITMIFPDGSAGADQRERQEQEPGDFQPEHMQHPAHATQRDATCAVKGPVSYTHLTLPTKRIV